MVPWLQPQLITVGADSLAHGGRGRATFVAFAPNGVSWFIRSDPKQCIWGPDIATFPVTWQSIIANLEANHPRKDECIDFVAFGVYDLLLVRFENGNAAMYLPDDPAMRHKFSAELIKEVQDRLAAGWTIGNRTALCAFDTNRWFIEWKRGTMAKFRYSTVLGDGPKENEGCERISNVLRGVGNNAGLVASNQNAQLVGDIIQHEATLADDYRLRRTRLSCSNLLSVKFFNILGDPSPSGF